MYEPDGMNASNIDLSEQYHSVNHNMRTINMQEHTHTSMHHYFLFDEQ